MKYVPGPANEQVDLSAALVRPGVIVGGLAIREADEEVMRHINYFPFV